MKISNKKYFEKYLSVIGNEIPKLIEEFPFAERTADFSFLTKASAVFSSNIEGNTIDLNSYMNYELSKSKFKPEKEIKEIENLIAAYEFAQSNPLTEKNMLKAHAILSEPLLIKSKRGKYRSERTGVFGESGLVYLAIEPEFVETETKKLFDEIGSLLDMELNVSEIFYFASFIHLRLVHIHPFADGNGRIARLTEKWFLSEKLGKDLWVVPSEKYYKIHQTEYYAAINLGVNFYELDYENCVNFLKLLPESLKLK
jgi:Fic family protein